MNGKWMINERMNELRMVERMNEQIKNWYKDEK